MKFDASTSPSGQTSSPNAIWMFLICCGFAGICLMFNFTKDGQRSGFTDEKTIRYSAQPPVVQSSLLPTSETPSGKLFRVNDWLEAKKPAVFTLQEASEGVTYELELPDGTRKTFVKNKVHHTFSQTGEIVVRLWASYDGQSKELQALPYQVAHAAQIEAPASFVEM